MNILITGSNGQLGSEIKHLKSGYEKLNFIFTDVENLDICYIDDVEKFIAQNNIEFIVNCAAYTNVDAAETDIEQAKKINETGPLILAEVSNKRGIPLIHISSDYVYDSEKQNTPFVETGPLKPVSIYGKTKLQGEKNVSAVNPKHIIIRTSWLYSIFGKNFVKSMLKYADEREILNIVFDQTGTPTYARDLAKAIIIIIEKYKQAAQQIIWGIYNFSNEGVCSWYDFAHEIIHISKKECKVLPIETKQYPTPAKRPSYSVMNKNKMKTNFDLEINHWKKSLEKFFEDFSKS